MTPRCKMFHARRYGQRYGHFRWSRKSGATSRRYRIRWQSLGKSNACKAPTTCVRNVSAGCPESLAFRSQAEARHFNAANCLSSTLVATSARPRAVGLKPLALAENAVWSCCSDRFTPRKEGAAGFPTAPFDSKSATPTQRQSPHRQTSARRRQPAPA